jgi:tripartite-type tricarboxylate transporter receptor subunit TctC
MNNVVIRWSVGTLIFLAALLAIPVSKAANWPTKAIELVIPYPPGGSSDIIGRLIAKHLAETLKQPVVVVNKGGAATAIGTAYVARSTADGYRLLLADSPLVVNAAINPAIPYRLFDDFAPIAIIGTSPSFLYAPMDGSKSLAELITKAKQAPGQVPFASAGSGTSTHLLLEIFQREAKAKFNHIPYKGSAPALMDTASGTVAASFSTYASAESLVSAGKLRVIAMTSEERLDLFPGIPTLKEAGYDGATMQTWWGVLAPAGLPADINKKLQSALVQAVPTKEVGDQFRRLSVLPTEGTPEDFQAVIKNDFKRWKDVITAAQISLQ